jgi:hypothetical protein
MRTLLKQILMGTDLQAGRWTIYSYSDNSSITARHFRSGMMGPDVKPNLAGLRRLLAWIDQQPT